MDEYRAAIARWLGDTKPLMSERVSLDQAEGRVLASPLVTSVNIPPFTHSTMDGYALTASSLPAEGPFTLEVVGESRAGVKPPSLQPGTACRIFTGAKLPSGADTVIVQEEVTCNGSQLAFSNRPAAWTHIRLAGHEMEAGKECLVAGTRLGPFQLGLAACVDCSHVEVVRRPVLCIVSTGDELRYPGERSREASIPESVSVVIRALAKRASAEVRMAPFARDNLDKTTQILRQALRGADLTVTVGGSGVGDHDLVKPALARLGVELDSREVNMRPGKRLVFGAFQGGKFLGLPGTPQGAQVAFMLFGLPLLRTLQGDSCSIPSRVQARLAAPVHHKKLLEFQNGVLNVSQGQLVVQPGNQGRKSASTSQNCLIVLPEVQEVLEQGVLVEVIRFEDL